MSQLAETESPTTLDLAAAAEHFSLSLPALRKRIQRGQIAAIKVDGKLRVVVDSDKDMSQGQATAPKDKGQPMSQRSAGPQLVTLLQDEVVFLRGQLTARNDEVQRLVTALEAERIERQQLAETAERAQSEMRQLVAQAQQLHRVALLPAPVEDHPAADDSTITTAATPPPPSPHWWQFWHRTRGAS